MKKVIVIVFFLIVIGGLVGYRIVTRGSGAAEKSIAEIQNEEGVPVEVAKANISDMIIYSRYSGTVEGTLQAVMKSEVGEKISRVNKRPGDRVKKGDVILEFNKASANSMMLRLDQIELQLADAKKDYDRAKKLHDVGAVSPQDLEKAKLQYDLMKQNYSTAKSSVKVTSPMNGIVTKIYYYEGETPGMGTELAQVAKIDRVKIKFPVSEVEFNTISKGQNAIVTVDTYPAKTFTGFVKDIDMSADPVSRNFDVTLELQNPDNLLKPGMFARISVEVEKSMGTIVVPRNAVIEEDGQSFVWLVTGNTASKKAVSTGLKDKDMTEVTSGLKAGDTVVTLGYNNIVENNQKVIVIE